MSMGHLQEYRNGYFSAAMIENADFAGSCEMIGVVVSPTAMRVLNNKTYFSSPRFFQSVKYRIPIKDPTRKQRKRFDRLATLNLLPTTKTVVTIILKYLCYIKPTLIAYLLGDCKRR